MQGCNMRCGYCHNPETRGLCDSCGECIAACPEGALSRSADGSVAWDEGRCASCDRCIAACPRDASPRARRLEASALASLIAPLEPFIDGITFSGGECCLQGPFLLGAAARLHELRPDLGIIADTNGALEAEPFASLIAGLDGFIFDLKAWNDTAHAILTGLPKASVTRNLEAAAAAGKLVEVRTVLIAGVNDSGVDILASARYLAKLGSDFPWRLLPFRPQGARGDFASIHPYPRSGFEAALKLARSVIGNRAVGPAVAS